MNSSVPTALNSVSFLFEMTIKAKKDTTQNQSMQIAFIEQGKTEIGVKKEELE